MKPFQTTPVFHVSDIKGSLDYYLNVLGFEEVFKWGDPVYYAGVRYQSVVIHLNAAESVSDRIGHGAVYIFAESGVQEYFDEIMKKGAVLAGNPPRKYDYGMLDVKFADPDGNWITFGEEA